MYYKRSKIPWEKIPIWRQFMEVELEDKYVDKVVLLVKPREKIQFKKCILCGRFLGDKFVVRLIAVQKEWLKLRGKIQAWGHGYKRIPAKKLFTHEYYFHLKCFIMCFGDRFCDELKRQMKKHYKTTSKEFQRLYTWCWRYRSV
mgnify:CR=1 FL=1